MKHIFLFTVLMLMFCFRFNGQVDEPRQKEQDNKVSHPYIVGGSIGLQFGTITYVDINPKIGYRFTESFTTGMGGIYKYFRDRRYDPSYSTNVYGGRIFAQHDVYKPVYAYGELEYLLYEGYVHKGGSRTLENIQSTNLLIGGGFKQWLGKRSYAYIMLLYNINETIHTPYENPVFRTGFILRL
ncbi:MAG: hypothetical protein R6U19_05620 [Bacteroidales bacterium]